MHPEFFIPYLYHNDINTALKSIFYYLTISIKIADIVYTSGFPRGRRELIIEVKIALRGMGFKWSAVQIRPPRP